MKFFYPTKVTFLSLLLSDMYEHSEKDYKQLYFVPPHSTNPLVGALEALRMTVLVDHEGERMAALCNLTTLFFTSFISKLILRLLQ